MRGSVEATVWCGCGDAIPDDDLTCVDCWAEADGFTEDRIVAALLRDPSIIGRARIQPAEALRIATALWDALTTEARP